MSAKLGPRLPAVLAPGAFVLSDLPLELSGTRRCRCLPARAKADIFSTSNGPHADG